LTQITGFSKSSNLCAPVLPMPCPSSKQQARPVRCPTVQVNFSQKPFPEKESYTKNIFGCARPEEPIIAASWWLRVMCVASVWWSAKLRSRFDRLTRREKTFYYEKMERNHVQKPKKSTFLALWAWKVGIECGCQHGDGAGLRQGIPAPISPPSPPPRESLEFYEVVEVHLLRIVIKHFTTKIYGLISWLPAANHETCACDVRGASSRGKKRAWTLF